MGEEIKYSPEPGDLDVLDLQGHIEAGQQFITNPDSADFGKIKPTAEMQAAAEQINANISAGRPEETTVLGNGISPYAEQIGRKVAGPDATAAEVRAAARSAPARACSSPCSCRSRRRWRSPAGGACSESRSGAEARRRSF